MPVNNMLVEKGSRILHLDPTGMSCSYDDKRIDVCLRHSPCCGTTGSPLFPGVPGFGTVPSWLRRRLAKSMGRGSCGAPSLSKDAHLSAF